jgi:hypothetical protein
MSWFAIRCGVFGLLWALGVVAAMVWSMEQMPTVWGMYKLAAAGVAAFVFGVFTYVRDPESAWSNTPGAGTVKTLPKVGLILALGLSACAAQKAAEAPVAPALTKTQCEAMVHAAYRATSADDRSSGLIFMQIAQRGGCF